MRPSSAVNASFYRSRRDLVSEQLHGAHAHSQRMGGGAMHGGSGSIGNRQDDAWMNMHEGFTESLDITPLAPAAPPG